jgi:4-alpha-glucanotransferase
MKFSHEGRRISGIAVPLAAIRSELSPGCGEFPDLARAGDLARAWGLELVQLLPVNDSGYQSSPYFALSAFALHPIYIRIGDLPELLAGKNVNAGGEMRDGEMRDRAPGFLAEADSLVRQYSKETRVPFEALLRKKVDLLRRIWQAASEGPGPSAAALLAELQSWIAANPWSRSYAAFVALKSAYAEQPWWEWPRLRDPSPADIDSLWAEEHFAKDLRFWAWLQMRAAAQFEVAAQYLADIGIALMGDIPILMNADSADVWSQRACFQLQLSAGAPPDMYSELGQNWGFPIYNWEILEKSGYGFWLDRLRAADKYYSCYRIDHVLGFFRIWSLSERERTGALGRFIPDLPVTRSELEGLGFSPERVRWLSRPHVPIWRLIQAAGEAAAKAAAFAALERIGNEDLFLFKDSIRGERDIDSLPLVSPAARDCLISMWRDRALFEFEPEAFVTTWNFRSTTCWPTLSEAERGTLEEQFRIKRAQAEGLWASTGKKLLGALVAAVPMLPCAEDLGSVPDCVPSVLEELGILGLRVLRWTRRWQENGQPQIPVTEYPEASIACPSVHDSSSLREWWEEEADREGLWRFAALALGRDLGPCQERLGTEQVEALLELVARSASRFAVFPVQDLLAMSEKMRPVDPKTERINVPGTVGIANWSYRMPFTIDDILAEKKLLTRVRRVAKVRLGPKHLGGKAG